MKKSLQFVNIFWAIGIEQEKRTLRHYSHSHDDHHPHQILVGVIVVLWNLLSFFVINKNNEYDNKYDNEYDNRYAIKCNDEYLNVCLKVYKYDNECDNEYGNKFKYKYDNVCV